MRTFESPDATRWRVEVTMPGASNAMVVFHHPTAGSGRRNRYAWYNADVPEARSVTARLDPGDVLKRLKDDDIARLFRRSMPISAADTPLDTTTSQ